MASSHGGSTTSESRSRAGTAGQRLLSSKRERPGEVDLQSPVGKVHGRYCYRKQDAGFKRQR